MGGEQAKIQSRVDEGRMEKIFLTYQMTKAEPQCRLETDVQTPESSATNGQSSKGRAERGESERERDRERTGKQKPSWGGGEGGGGGTGGLGMMGMGMVGWRGGSEKEREGGERASEGERERGRARKSEGQSAAGDTREAGERQRARTEAHESTYLTRFLAVLSFTLSSLLPHSRLRLSLSLFALPVVDLVLPSSALIHSPSRASHSPVREPPLTPTASPVHSQPKSIFPFCPPFSRSSPR